MASPPPRSVLSLMGTKTKTPATSGDNPIPTTPPQVTGAAFGSKSTGGRRGRRMVDRRRSASGGSSGPRPSRSRRGSAVGGPSLGIAPTRASSLTPAARHQESAAFSSDSNEYSRSEYGSGEVDPSVVKESEGDAPGPRSPVPVSPKVPPVVPSSSPAADEKDNVSEVSGSEGGSEGVSESGETPGGSAVANDDVTGTSSLLKGSSPVAKGKFSPPRPSSSSSTSSMRNSISSLGKAAALKSTPTPPLGQGGSSGGLSDPEQSQGKVNTRIQGNMDSLDQGSRGGRGEATLEESEGYSGFRSGGEGERSPLVSVLPHPAPIAPKSPLVTAIRKRHLSHQQRGRSPTGSERSVGAVNPCDFSGEESHSGLSEAAAALKPSGGPAAPWVMKPDTAVPESSGSDGSGESDDEKDEGEESEDPTPKTIAELRRRRAPNNIHSMGAVDRIREAFKAKVTLDEEDAMGIGGPQTHRGIGHHHHKKYKDPDHDIKKYLGFVSSSDDDSDLESRDDSDCESEVHTDDDHSTRRRKLAFHLEREERRADRRAARDKKREEKEEEAEKKREAEIKEKAEQMHLLRTKGAQELLFCLYFFLMLLTMAILMAGIRMLLTAHVLYRTNALEESPFESSISAEKPVCLHEPCTHTPTPDAISFAEENGYNLQEFTSSCVGVNTCDGGRFTCPTGFSCVVFPTASISDPTYRPVTPRTEVLEYGTCVSNDDACANIDLDVCLSLSNSGSVVYDSSSVVAPCGEVCQDREITVGLNVDFLQLPIAGQIYLIVIMLDFGGFKAKFRQLYRPEQYKGSARGRITRLLISGFLMALVMYVVEVRSVVPALRRAALNETCMSSAARENYIIYHLGVTLSWVRTFGVPAVLSRVPMLLLEFVLRTKQKKKKKHHPNHMHPEDGAAPPAYPPGDTQMIVADGSIPLKGGKAVEMRDVR